MQALPHAVRVLLESLDDPEKVMAAVLDHALLESGAVRGLIFDRRHLLRSVGFSPADRVAAWQSLEALLVEPGGVRHYAGARFTCIAGEAVGLAGALGCAGDHVAVMAIEKETPFMPSEIRDFSTWLEVAGKPLDVSLFYERWKRQIAGRPLRLRDLPLEDLQHLPNLAEVERLLMQVAMSRHQNNKGRAAAALGLSREGFRRKLEREFH